MINQIEFLKVFCSLAETLHSKETATILAISPKVVTDIIGRLEKLHPQQSRLFQYKINQRTHSGWFLIVL